MSLSSEELGAVPACLDWSVEEVGDWIETIGFPQYRVGHRDLSLGRKKLLINIFSEGEFCGECCEW